MRLFSLMTLQKTIIKGEGVDEPFFKSSHNIGVMEAQYDGLVSGDADHGKKGSTLGVTARAQWRGSIGMKPDTWVGLEHKACMGDRPLSSGQ